ncbi:MAG: glycosyltransferase family 39 protein [Vicinamibacteria bacterium]
MTRPLRLALAIAVLFGAAARFDAVSRTYPADRDQRTDVRRYYQAMAESVLAGKGWLPSYPTNFIPPPGQAIFILIPKWLMPGIDFRELRILQALISTATVLMGFAIASRLWGSLAGVTAAWMLAFSYPLIFYVGTLVPETNYLACLFAFLFACVEAQRAPSTWRFATAGALLGLAVIFKPVPSLLAVALVPWVWRSSVAAQRARNTLVFVLAAWIVPGIWIARNAIHYGHLYPVSTNGGTLLALANNEGLDSTRSDMIYWDDLYRRADLFRDPAIEARYAGTIDVDGKPEENLKDREYAKSTLRYIASHPHHFVRNYAFKLGNFLIYPRPGELPPEDRPRIFSEIWFLQDALLALGLLGGALLLSRPIERARAAALLILLGYLVAMGALMHLTRDGRMNFPVRALLTFPAAFAVASAWARLKGDPRTPSAR